MAAQEFLMIRFARLRVLCFSRRVALAAFVFILAAIERQCRTFNKPYYSIPDLALRWRCSRATVYVVLKKSEFKVLDLAVNGKDKGKKLISASVVEKIENARTHALSETAA
jgi:hypothetical protein